MSIKYIDSITIGGRGNGVDSKLYNGYIYRVNYNVSMGSSKSTLTANLVSEDGTYTFDPLKDLNFTRPHTIKIGDSIAVNMYLERAKKIVEPGSRILELTFSDTSVKMDRYFVGLYKRHGLKSKGNVIILGREVHPCDRDYDGDIDSIDDLVDICHPCRNTAAKSVEVETVKCKDLNKYMVFPVNYNFTELIKELRKTFRIEPVKDPNPSYRAPYTGTVREVLQEWCSNFGWSFYWEEETIKFLDLRRTINVTTAISNYCPNLSAYEEEFSLDGTVDNVINTYYERSGSNDKQECEDALYFQIPAYTPNVGGLPGALQITRRIPEIAAGLVQYSKELRDLWYAYDKYALRSAADYKPGKSMPKLGLTILSSAITLNNSASGGLGDNGGLGATKLESSEGLSVPNGFPTSPEPTSSLNFLDYTPPTAALLNVQAAIKANEKYKMCFELMKAEDQWIVANGLAKDPEDFFFFVAYHDSSIQDAYIAEEEAYGRDFMGRYHIMMPDLNDPVQAKFFEDYTFKQDQICNIKIKTNDGKITYNFLPNGGGERARFFNNPGESPDGTEETLSALPFSNWLHLFRESRDAVNAPNRDRMFKLLVVDKQGDNLFYPAPGIERQEEDEVSSSRDAIKSQALIEKAQQYTLIRIENTANDQQESVPRKLLANSKVDKNIDRTKVFVFIGRKIQGGDFRIVSNNAMNLTCSYGIPFDGEPLRTDFEDEFDIKGQTVYKYPDIKCKMTGNLNNFCKKRSFHTPVATFTYFEPTYSDFGVVIEKRKQIHKRVDKLQTNLMNKTSISERVASIRVIDRNISDEEIAIFNSKTNTSNSCRYNSKQIMDYHKKMSQHLDFTFDKPIVSKSFTVEGVGVVKPPKIGDGLIGIDISMDEEGIKTTYTLGTRLMQPMDPGVIKGLDSRPDLIGSVSAKPIIPYYNSSNQP